METEVGEVHNVFTDVTEYFPHTACTQLPSTKLPVLSPYLENNHSIIHTTRLIYHLSIYLLQFYWSHPSHKPPHNVTATLTIQGNRMKSAINTLNGITYTNLPFGVLIYNTKTQKP